MYLHHIWRRKEPKWLLLLAKKGASAKSSSILGAIFALCAHSSHLDDFTVPFSSELLFNKEMHSISAQAILLFRPNNFAVIWPFFINFIFQSLSHVGEANLTRSFVDEEGPISPNSFSPFFRNSSRRRSILVKTTSGRKWHRGRSVRSRKDLLVLPKQRKNV